MTDKLLYCNLRDEEYKFNQTCRKIDDFLNIGCKCRSKEYSFVNKTFKSFEEFKVYYKSIFDETASNEKYRQVKSDLKGVYEKQCVQFKMDMDMSYLIVKTLENLINDYKFESTDTESTAIESLSSNEYFIKKSLSKYLDGLKGTDRRHYKKIIESFVVLMTAKYKEFLVPLSVLDHFTLVDNKGKKINMAKKNKYASYIGEYNEKLIQDTKISIERFLCNDYVPNIHLLTADCCFGSLHETIFVLTNARDEGTSSNMSNSHCDYLRNIYAKLAGRKKKKINKIPVFIIFYFDSQENLHLSTQKAVYWIETVQVINDMFSTLALISQMFHADITDGMFVDLPTLRDLNSKYRTYKDVWDDLLIYSMIDPNMTIKNRSRGPSSSTDETEHTMEDLNQMETLSTSRKKRRTNINYISRWHCDDLFVVPGFLPVKCHFDDLEWYVSRIEGDLLCAYVVITNSHFCPILYLSLQKVIDIECFVEFKSISTGSAAERHSPYVFTVYFNDGNKLSNYLNKFLDHFKEYSIHCFSIPLKMKKRQQQGIQGNRTLNIRNNYASLLQEYNYIYKYINLHQFEMNKEYFYDKSNECSILPNKIIDVKSLLRFFNETNTFTLRQAIDGTSFSPRNPRGKFCMSSDIRNFDNVRFNNDNTDSKSQQQISSKPSPIEITLINNFDGQEQLFTCQFFLTSTNQLYSLQKVNCGKDVKLDKKSFMFSRKVLSTLMHFIPFTKIPSIKNIWKRNNNTMCIDFPVMLGKFETCKNTAKIYCKNLLIGSIILVDKHILSNSFVLNLKDYDGILATNYSSRQKGFLLFLYDFEKVYKTIWTLLEDCDEDICCFFNGKLYINLNKRCQEKKVDENSDEMIIDSSELSPLCEMLLSKKLSLNLVVLNEYSTENDKNMINMLVKFTDNQIVDLNIPIGEEECIKSSEQSSSHGFFKCPICREECKESMYALECGHLLCEDCLNRVYDEITVSPCHICRRLVFKANSLKIFSD